MKPLDLVASLAKDSLTAAQQAWLDEADREPPPTKEDAPCCLAHRLRDGRLPIGFCSAECIRRRT